MGNGRRKYDMIMALMELTLWAERKDKVLDGIGEGMERVVTSLKHHFKVLYSTPLYA